MLLLFFSLEKKIVWERKKNRSEKKGEKTREKMIGKEGEKKRELCGVSGTRHTDRVNSNNNNREREGEREREREKERRKEI